MTLPPTATWCQRKPRTTAAPGGPYAASAWFILRHARSYRTPGCAGSSPGACSPANLFFGMACGLARGESVIK